MNVVKNKKFVAKKWILRKKTILRQKSGNGGVYKDPEKKKTFLQNQKIPKISVFF